MGHSGSLLTASACSAFLAFAPVLVAVKLPGICSGLPSPLVLGLSDQLALAPAQLAVPGDEEIFAWRHGEHIYEIRAYPVEDEEGVFLVAFEDETDHIQTEEILSEIRRYNENVLKNIPFGVIVLNSGLRVNFITPQEIQLLGHLGIELTLFDLIGSTLTELLPPEPGTEWHRMCGLYCKAAICWMGENRSIPRMREIYSWRPR